MDIYNINSISINNKIINSIDWGETDITKNTNNLDCNIISTIKSNKILRDMIIKKIEEEIEKHNYMNSVLYYDTMVNNDCYTFYDGVSANFEISIFNYDKKSKYLSLSSENTLINTFSFVSIYNKSDLMLSCGKSKSRYFESIHIPRILKYNPQNLEDKADLNSSNVEYSISGFSNKKYVSQYSYEQYLKNSELNENNLYTEFMAEHITGDLFYESSKIFITLPTIVRFDPENNKYEFAKFARLSDYSLFGITQNDSGDEIEYPYYLKYYFNYISNEHPKNYYHYYNRKSNNLSRIDINNVLVAYYEVEEDIWVLNEQNEQNEQNSNSNEQNSNSNEQNSNSNEQNSNSNEQNENEQNEQNSNSNEQNSNSNEQNENEQNSNSNEQNENEQNENEQNENEQNSNSNEQNENEQNSNSNEQTKFTGILDIIVNIHENSDSIISGSAQIYGNLNNNEIWINDNVNFNLTKSTTALNQIQATHQIQVTQNIQHINKNMVIIEDSIISNKLGCVADLDTSYLSSSNLINGNLKIMKIEGIEQTNPKIINFSNNITLNTVSSTNSQIIGKLNVEIYSDLIEFRSFTTYDNINITTYNKNEFNLNSSCSIVSRDISGKTETNFIGIPKYKVSKNNQYYEYEIDPTKYHKERRTINKIMFECYYSNKNKNEIYTYVPPTEKTISINNNANDSRNKTMPIYGFTYKIAGGSNLNIKTLPGMYLKLIMDYYSSNDLHNVVLIKRMIPISKSKLWIKGNEYPSNDFYKHIYGEPFITDNEFHLNDLRDFYEICYGFPYSPEIENYIIDYFKNIEKKDLGIIIPIGPLDLKPIASIDTSDLTKIIETSNISLGLRASDYSDIVFKSGRDINNIYIAAYANEYTDFKHKYKHCYKIFDFNDCNNVKTIEISSEINGVMIYFKTKNLNKIDFYLNGLNNNLRNVCELLENENENKNESEYKYYRLFIN
jgi:hypothetical protein